MWKILSTAAICAVCMQSVVHAQPYHDAEVFDARGPVRQIKVETILPDKTVTRTYTFSSEGVLTATDYGPILDLERDAQGRLTKYVFDAFESSYRDIEYDGAGRVVHLFSSSADCTYRYNEEGLIVGETNAIFGIPSDTYYHYHEFDSFGNWTSRDVDWISQSSGATEKRQEVRTIEYWTAGSETPESDVAAGSGTDKVGTKPVNGRIQSGTSEDKRGGFLLASFSKLAEGRARKQEMARELREKSLQRRAEAAAEAIGATRLTARAMIENPLGVLTVPLSYDEAVERLKNRTDWTPDLSEPWKITLSPEQGYDLAYDGFVPEVVALFSSGEGHMLQEYGLTFTYIQGGNLSEATPVNLVRHKAVTLAQKIVTAWQAEGFVVEEETEVDPSQFDFAMYCEEPARTTRIRVSGKKLFVPNVFYSVHVNVTLH